MAVAERAAAFYRRQALIGLQASRRAQEAWRLDPSDLDGSFVRSANAVAKIITAAQLVAAAAAEPYVSAVVAEQQIRTRVAGAVVPAALAGRAASGRPLVEVLVQTLIRAKTRIGQGADPAAVVQLSRVEALRTVSTQVADAGRTATTVAITARPAVEGYVRHLQPPSCQRCTSLASEWHEWPEGFSRHSSCDCIAAPSQREAAPDLTPAAPRGEGDLMHGMASTGELGESAGGRPNPEQITAAADSRDEAISTLLRFGYLTAR